MDTNLIPSINQTFQIELPENISFEIMKEKLSVYINNLIETDFEKLVSILYRIDVNEIKLKKLLLENNGEDASKIIADLIIERQLQKIESRKIFKPKNEESNEEKW